MKKTADIDFNFIMQLETARKSLEGLPQVCFSDKIITEYASDKEEIITSMIKEEHERIVRENCEIYYHQGTESNNKSYYYAYVYDPTCIKNRRRLTNKDEKKLIECLFDILREGRIRKDASFKEVFEYAIDAYLCDNPSTNTVRKYRADYERFIAGASFEDRGIGSLRLEDIKAHTMQLLKTKTINKKAFMAYKGVLNLVIDYGINKGIIGNDPRIGFKNKAYYDLLKSSSTPNKHEEYYSDSDEAILSPEEINRLKDIVRDDISKRKYVYFGYAVILATLTGMRVGEICALHWSDIHFSSKEIHIHRQQLDELRSGKHVFYEVPFTKNEKKLEPDKRKGRMFPIYDEIEELLLELKSKQDELGIKSEYVFCNDKGRFITVRGYQRYLRNKCQMLGYEITNNHALRKSLNSNVFVAKLGLTPTVRAELLGHSESTNIKFYTYAPKDTTASVLDAFHRIRDVG